MARRGRIRLPRRRGGGGRRCAGRRAGPARRRRSRARAPRSSASACRSTRSTSASRCAGRQGFSSIALKPARCASFCISAVQCPVMPSRGTWRVRRSARSAAASANPSSPGMLMSVTTMSGTVSTASPRASLPSMLPDATKPDRPRNSRYPLERVRIVFGYQHHQALAGRFHADLIGKRCASAKSCAFVQSRPESRRRH